MRNKIKIIISILLVVILFTIGCTQQQEQSNYQKVQLDPQSALFVKDPELSSNELFDVRYLYIPNDINSERILVKLKSLNHKYGDVVHITKFDMTKGIPEELKKMGYSGDKGAPSMIIGDTLIEPFTDENNRDLDVFEIAIKDVIAKK